MNWRSLVFRLLALYCGLLLVLGASFSVFAVFSFERYARETIRANVATRASEIWGIVQGALNNRGEVASLIEQRFSPEEQDRFIRISMDGAMIYRSGPPADKSFDPARIPAPATPTDAVDRTYGDLILYARRFAAPDGKAVTVESGQSDLFARGMEFSLSSSLITGLPLLLLAAAAGGYVLIRRALSPVEVMINAAEAISFNNPRNRLPLLGTGDRVEALGVALNRMLDRLDSAYQHANRFSSDAAHELRTPLAIIQGELEFVLSRGRLAPESETAIATVHEEATRLGKIVQNLLTLSRMERPSGQRPHVPVDICALAAETVDQMHLLAAERQVTLRPPQRAKIIVSGDRDRLKQVFVNLIDNAIKYNVPGGYVSVDVVASGGNARITFSDSGIGIAPEHREFIFDRFFRVSGNRGDEGAGLGLAIVQSICHAHGGNITVSAGAAGGSVFCVTLPLSPSERHGGDEAVRAGVAAGETETAV